ncbi:hypothetical protein F4779DRAFT_117831 [Xylariaceae sp. FL0662B]|nr:hypothetical protein F4779DRAFT_117831 [Xylariaceae sp. FL0662B]
MDAEADTNDIQSRVLQNTLAEVASRHPPSESDKPTEACCVICLDNITEACEARPCKHRNFDYLCLLSWLEQQTRCPLCKCDIEEVWYDFGNEGLERTSRTYVVPRSKKSAKQQERSHAEVLRPHNATPRPYSRRYGESTNRRVTEDEAILRRRDVYRNQLYSLHVGSNRRSRYRDLTPQLFESEPEMVSRARAWLRRELQVFEFLRTPTTAQGSGDAMTRRRANNAEFLLEYIIAILKTVDIQGSQGQAEDMLKDFLGRDHTKLLLHELKSFLRSPWSLEAWDREVQYPSRKRQIYEDDYDGVDHLASSPGETRLTGGGADGRRRRTADSYRPTYASRRNRRIGAAPPI